MGKTIEVVCGVIGDGRGRYLVCLRKAGGPLPGVWEFPGGKIEHGEPAEAALVRELREELDIEVAVGAPLEPVEWQGDGPRIRLIPFLCAILSGTPRDLDHERIEWCEPGDFHALEWAPADIPIWREVVATGRETAV